LFWAANHGSVYARRLGASEYLTGLNVPLDLKKGIAELYHCMLAGEPDAQQELEFWIVQNERTKKLIRMIGEDSVTNLLLNEGKNTI